MLKATMPAKEANHLAKFLGGSNEITITLDAKGVLRFKTNLTGSIAVVVPMTETE